MITRIEAYNYRCFAQLSIDLDRFHVLAGANGAGKTTLLDIPTLLGDLLQSRSVAGAFLERRGNAPARANSLRELLHKGQGDTIAFAVEAKLPRDVVSALEETSQAKLGRLTLTHLRYEVRLAVKTRSLVITHEHLFLFPEDGTRPAPGEVLQGVRADQDSLFKEPDWVPVILRRSNSPTRYLPETTTQATDIPPLRIPDTQLALGAVPADPTLFPAALWFVDLLREDVVFYLPDWERLRRPAPPGDPRRVMNSAQNTPWLALDLQRSDPDRFASWVDHVQSALPQVASIRVIERDEDNHAYFSVDYQGGYRVTSSGLSEGTLRILSLSLLPYLDEDVLPSTLVTEEPENGIHPRAIETVVQSLNSIYESQVWVSTQSPLVLANTDLANILAARIQPDGNVVVVPGDEHPRLRDWQGSLDLGTLFAAGVFS